MLPKEGPVEPGVLEPNILSMECRGETREEINGAALIEKVEKIQSVNSRSSTESNKLTAPGGDKNLYYKLTQLDRLRCHSNTPL